MQKKCYRQTLLKGLLGLMGNKDKRSVLKLCKGSMHIFDVMYNEKLRQTPEERVGDTDFLHTFVSIRDVIKVL